MLNTWPNNPSQCVYVLKFKLNVKDEPSGGEHDTGFAMMPKSSWISSCIGHIFFFYIYNKSFFWLSCYEHGGAGIYLLGDGCNYMQKPSRLQEVVASLTTDLKTRKDSAGTSMSRAYEGGPHLLLWILCKFTSKLGLKSNIWTIRI